MEEDDIKLVVKAITYIVVALFVVGGLFFVYDAAFRPLYERNSRAAWEQSIQAGESFYQRFSVARRAFVDAKQEMASAKTDTAKEAARLQALASKDDMCSAYVQAPASNSVKNEIKKQLDELDVTCN